MRVVEVLCHTVILEQFETHVFVVLSKLPGNRRGFGSGDTDAIESQTLDYLLSDEIVEDGDFEEKIELFKTDPVGIWSRGVGRPRLRSCTKVLRLLVK